MDRLFFFFFFLNIFLFINNNLTFRRANDFTTFKVLLSDMDSALAIISLKSHAASSDSVFHYLSSQSPLFYFEYL